VVRILTDQKLVRFTGITEEEKRRYLIETSPAAAALASKFGSSPLHHAAEHGKSTAETLRMLYQANPKAIRQRNVDGKLPLELAVANKHRSLAILLCKLYDPSLEGPKKHKSALWVLQTYGEMFVNSRLTVDSSDDEQQDEDDDSRLTVDSSDDEQQDDDSCLTVDSPDDEQQDEDDDRKMHAKEANSIAEEAIGLSLSWLPSAHGLLSVRSVSKALCHAASSPHLWDEFLNNLDQKIPLHSQDLLDDLDFPPEFVDPRHCHEMYEALNSFEKANFLGQYRSMVLGFFLAEINDEAGIAHMRTLLGEVRSSAQEADRNGYFDDDNDDYYSDDEDECGFVRPVDVNKALGRCTLERVKEYCVQKVVKEFCEMGLLAHSSANVVVDGWEGFDFGSHLELDWVFFCHKIAGLGIVQHGWHGWFSY
jgi:hypothetical protein